MHTAKVLLVMLFFLLGITSSACAPATPVPPTGTPTPTIFSTETPLPPTWTPTDTATPRPPTYTPTASPTATPFDAASACESFVLESEPPPGISFTGEDMIYFVWSIPPPETQVRLVLTRAREFNALHIDITRPRSNNGIALPAINLPFSGTIHWQVLLLYQGEVVCRLDGQLRKTAPSFADIFNTPSPSSASTQTAATSVPTVAATPDE